MPNPLVMGDPTSGPTLAGVPGAGTVIATNAMVLLSGTPVGVVTDQTGPTGPLVTPLAPMILVNNKPIGVPGPTGTGANPTATKVLKNVG